MNFLKLTSDLAALPDLVKSSTKRNQQPCGIEGEEKVSLEVPITTRIVHVIKPMWFAKLFGAKDEYIETYTLKGWYNLDVDHVFYDNKTDTVILKSNRIGEVRQ